MTPYATDIVEALLMVTKTIEPQPGMVYRSGYDFVALHGREYLVCPFEGAQGLPKMCFGNAITEAAMHGYKYVEGFALSPEGYVIPHAWCERPDGRLHDATWMNTALAYVGVEFSVERADDATWNGDGSVLQDEKRGDPLFRQLWRGEDYTLTWPYSDRLAMLRSGQTASPESIREWLEKLRKDAEA